MRKWLKQLFCRHEWWPATAKEMLYGSTHLARCTKCSKVWKKTYWPEYGSLAKAAFFHNSQLAEEWARKIAEESGS